MQWLAIAKVVLSLWPILKEIVAKIEEAFPQAGIGLTHKLPAAMSLVEDIFRAMGDVGVSFESAVPALKTSISALVSLSKATAPTVPSQGA